MGYTIEHPEPNILSIYWDGDLTVETLIEVTNARIAYAKEHVSGDYVVILDVRVVM